MESSRRFWGGLERKVPGVPFWVRFNQGSRKVPEVLV